jgi:hypothetical protein
VARKPDPQAIDVAQALEHLGRLSLRQHSMQSLLQTVADLTKTVMPGHPEASVSLLVKDNPSTVAYTDQLAFDLDATQYERDHGPCLHAARSGEVTELADTRKRPLAGLRATRHPARRAQLAVRPPGHRRGRAGFWGAERLRPPAERL